MTDYQLALSALAILEKAESGAPIAALWRQVQDANWRAGIALSHMIEERAEPGTKWLVAFDIMCDA